MDKILEALTKLLPEDQVKEVADTLNGILDQSKSSLAKEFEAKLAEAYAQHEEELKNTEKVAEEGYQQAAACIQDLRNKLELQREEFESELEKGYEEAFEHIKKEQSKNENIEVEMYGEYEKKLEEMRDYIVDKVDEFLKLKGGEIYEQAKRDVINDPRMVEHKVALDRILEVAQNYVSDEEYSLATSSKLNEALNSIEELKGQLKILEARNIRVTSQKEQLQEEVRKTKNLLNQQVKVVTTEGKKERAEKATKASGRGKIVTEDVIAEYSNPESVAQKDDEVLAEGSEYYDLNVLAGTTKS